MRHLPVRNHSFRGNSSVRRRGNPYFADRTADRIGSSAFKNLISKLPPRFWLILAALIALGAICLWLAGWASFLQVAKIEVRGASLVPPIAIEQLAYSRLEEKRLFVLPESGLILYNSSKLETEIRERYPVDDLRIIKRLPATLIISLTEKTPVAVWFEADSFYQVNREGWILSVVEGPIEGLVTLYNNGMPAVDDKRLIDKTAVISFSAELQKQFTERFSAVPIKQLFVDNEPSTVKLVPMKGALIYFSSSEAVEVQLNRLELLLRTELKDRFMKLRYIDLRFGDKVYYQ